MRMGQENERRRKEETMAELERNRLCVSAMEEECMEGRFREEYAEELYPVEGLKKRQSREEQKQWKKTGMRRYRKALWVLFAVSLLFLLAFCYIKFLNSIPNQVRIMVDRTEEFDFDLPVRADFSEENVGVLSVNESNIPAGELHLNLQDSFTLRAEELGHYEVDLKLFGFISLKQISVDVIESMEVIPCGNPVGITIETKGALVLGTGVVTGADGRNYEPAEAIVQTGDYIVAVNGESIEGKEELIAAVQNTEGDYVELRLLREEKEHTVKVQRIRTAAGDYKLGIWVRDDTQGIGTLTYVTTTGEFGALGHGIADVDTGVLMKVSEGDIYEAEIISITKGKSGKPGELTGVIQKSQSSRLGTVEANTKQGIFGEIALESGIIERLEAKSKYGIMEIGLRQQVKTGPATILCQVDGTLREYTIEIESVDYGNIKQSKGLVVHITDEELIEKTGGIVQGMSGSPILQNGKLIGAVTHVFVNDPTRGYGTFIENMLEAN